MHIIISYFVDPCGIEPKFLDKVTMGYKNDWALWLLKEESGGKRDQNSDSQKSSRIHIISPLLGSG